MEVKRMDKDLDFLRQISKDVDFKEDLTSEISDLEEYILKSKGYAIAACQIGYTNRVVYIRCSDFNKYDLENYNEK